MSFKDNVTADGAMSVLTDTLKSEKSKKWQNLFQDIYTVCFKQQQAQWIKTQILKEFKPMAALNIQ